MLPSSLKSRTIHYSTWFLKCFQSFFNILPSPVPVAAQAHKSRPRRPTGTQAFWIGVGCLKPSAVMACRYTTGHTELSTQQLHPFMVTLITFNVPQVQNNQFKNLQTFLPRQFLRVGIPLRWVWRGSCHQRSAAHCTEMHLQRMTLVPETKFSQR